MKKNYFMVFMLLLLGVTTMMAQEKTITGSVIDDQGIALPGVNIIVKGTKTGTQSDFDGLYTINATPGQTLTFSYVGFETQEKVVGTSNTINVNLVAGATLETVVITGYSKRNQTVQTSAVVTISASEISELAPTTSVDNLLQGKAAGVQVTSANGKPGQGAFVRIRGTGSLNAGGASPLYIIDGATIREQDLGQISNEDIETITILKDAATTARYGSRGANGVVVITTKSGNRNKDAVVRYSSRYGVTSRIEPNFDVMNTEQKLQYEAELFALGVTGGGPGVTTEPGSPERQFLLDNSTDWQDLILKEGEIQSNNVSISGGAEKVDYFFSLGHDRNTGIIDQLDGFERINSRLNVNFDAKKWLSVGANASYSRSTSDEPRDRNNVQNPFRAMYQYNPYETEFVLDEDGNLELDENGDPIYSPTSTSFNVRGALLSEPSEEIINNILASGNAQVNFTDNFFYGFMASFNAINQRVDGYSKPGGILDALIGDAANPGNKLDTGIYRSDITITNNLGYNFNKGKNDLDLLGLFEYNLNETRSYLVRSIGFPSENLSTQINAAQVTDGNTRRSKLALLSYGLFADYDYDERYLLSASVRTDASSNFGVDNQYGVFYSFSAGWNIAKESFFSVDAVNDLKLRGSYGTVGNRSSISRYASQGTLAFGNGYPGGSAATPSNIANPEIKWETTTSKNIGLELNMFNNRLSFVGDYFVRDTEDLLFNIPLADESGIGSFQGNLGEIQNKGLELSLSADIIRNSNFKWTVGGNIIFLDTEIVSLPEGEDVTPNAFNILFREGAKINEHYLVRYDGVDPATGRPLYLNAAGESVTSEFITDEDRVLQGKSTIADKEGGFFTNINYKGFGLRTDFVFKSGNWINNFVRSDLNSDGANIGQNQAVSAFNYWQNPGDTNVQPSPQYLNSAEGDFNINSDRFLEKGDYIRMRNVTLSYSVPTDYLEKSFINSFRVYLQGQNLLTFTDFYGDPEVGISSGEEISFANVVAPGEATLYSYPNTKSIQLGFDISF